MSTDRTCNSSFWTKEEDKIFETTLAIYFKGGDLLTKMEEALPWKSRDNILNHYKILIEDVDAIEFGRVPLPNYPELPSHSNQKNRSSKTDLAWRKGVAWTVEEHRSFLRGLAIYGRGDWRSIARHCVITRTSTQVASHAQKYFNHLKAVNKENRRMSIHDVTIVGADIAGTSQVPYTEGMILPACGGSQAVASSSNQSLLPQESTNAEQMLAVAGGESSGHSAAFVSGMNSMDPDEDDEFIKHIDDLIVDPEDANESEFLVDGGRSLLPSKQPCTAGSSGTNNHPIFRVGSDLEALITKQKNEDYDFTFILDDGEAPISHAMLSNASHSGMASFAVASNNAYNPPQNTVSAHSRMTSFAAASIGPNNAPQNMVADHPQSPHVAPSSNCVVGEWPQFKYYN
ncbi:hypothetical protein CQW23_15632 [Capsicum baccatum]|uniref:Uncharacterized protein n=1 Tax=Capsicum baccatum TaxID=33114 RepID=A0A2G2WMK7_CAPBA|nr:hypothetical protein CQW23_15632 [Capsicum baccatum]